MRQILYASETTDRGGRVDLAGILEQSRHNNAIDGISGLLWSDGTRFLQVIEGPEESVAATFARISADSRHCRVTILHDRTIEAREFGGWTMADGRVGRTENDNAPKIRRLLATASVRVSAEFLTMIDGDDRHPVARGAGR